jgi:putative MATE family efflux protein
MHDLTTGHVTRHLLKTTSYMLVAMVFQTLYFLIDLYWVGRLGTEAVAAVAIAGNVTFIVLALTQMLAIGTTTVVSHAVGRRDMAETNALFNQSQVLCTVTALAFLALGFLARLPYARAMSADAETAQLTADYLLWFIPAMSLQFLITGMGASLRAIGNFRTGTMVSTATIIINIILTPIMIFGWGTGRAFGVAGAALSTLISVLVAVLWLWSYFVDPEAPLHVSVRSWRPRLQVWKRKLAVGLPAGFEFAVMAVYIALIYTLTRPFGAAAQAGFGIGMRVVQAGFMPIVALGFAVAPVAGQNFGARRGDRVRRTWQDAGAMAAGWMLLLAIAAHVVPEEMVAVFTRDPAVVAVGAEYLRILSWSFFASGMIFVTSSTFQAMGNTVPSLVSSGSRFIAVAIPAVLISRLPGFQLRWLWWLSAATIIGQLGLSLILLRREFRRRLVFDVPQADAAQPVLARNS